MSSKTTPIRDNRRCIEGLLLGAGSRRCRAAGAAYYAVGDHSSGGAAKRAGIGANPRRSAAIAAISGTSACNGAPIGSIAAIRPNEKAPLCSAFPRWS
jgi:hypothetical protein